MLSVLLLCGLYFDTRKAPQRTELFFYNRCFMVVAERLRGSAVSPGHPVQGQDGKSAPVLPEDPREGARSVCLCFHCIFKSTVKNLFAANICHLGAENT